MWTRAELKTKAKAALSGNWINAIIVSLIAGILGVGAVSHAGGSSQHADNVTNAVGGGGVLESLIALGVVLIGVTLVVAIAFIISFFLTNVVEVGRDRFYLVNRGEEKPSIGMLFSGFDKSERGNYWNIVKTMMIVDLKVLVGVILFIIPGIYLTYVYRMVPFILANNPNMDPQKAQDLSKMMMDGQKLNTFILDLSFIGWDFVASLLLGLGYLVLDPYKAATNAELYDVLRWEAINNGWVTWDELPDMI